MVALCVSFGSGRDADVVDTVPNYTYDGRQQKVVSPSSSRSWARDLPLGSDRLATVTLARGAMGASPNCRRHASDI